MVKAKADNIKAENTQKNSAQLLQEDEGYQLAKEDAVRYLDTRHAAVVSVANRYHIDGAELAQEGYEVLLTCLRDFTPIVNKSDGTEVRVKFNTFFGSRLEVRAIEMRNRNPEYQARQAVTEQMSETERSSFRENPPLLVQHIDYETTMQESLKGEMAQAHDNMNENVSMRIMRDSFFDQKISELVRREKNPKKQAALLHVKVGGVYNFHEIAYHFGVTDSRASQVMNELMDAFYVQRLIDRDLKSVRHDFEKLNINEKRALRLLGEAFQHTDEQRTNEIMDIFSKQYKGLPQLRKKSLAQQKEQDLKKKKSDTELPALLSPPPEYENLLTEEEQQQSPLQEVGMRRIDSLKEISDLNFRPAIRPEFFKKFCAAFDPSDPLYPVLVAEDGTIIDGVLRLKAAKAEGRKDFLCLTIRIPNEAEKKRLRVVLNMRLHSASKVEMFYAIDALSSMGFSQQKIADNLQTGRTNVLVYCKLRDKGVPELRGLFEDELIQITNAATCADLTDEEQKNIVKFIRRYGKKWAKGKKFNSLYKAAAGGEIYQLEQSIAQNDGQEKPADFITQQTVTTQKETALQENEQASAQQNHQENPEDKRKIHALEQQVHTYAMSLKDQEIWSAQRESVINKQREELSDIKAEMESLRREVEAAELIKFGNTKALDEEVNQIRAFFAISERLSAAIKGADHACKDLMRTTIRRNQASELLRLMEEMEQSVNTLRVEIHNRCRTFRRERQENHDTTENPQEDKSNQSN